MTIKQDMGRSETVKVVRVNEPVNFFNNSQHLVTDTKTETILRKGGCEQGSKLANDF